MVVEGGRVVSVVDRTSGGSAAVPFIAGTAGSIVVVIATPSPVVRVRGRIIVGIVATTTPCVVVVGSVVAIVIAVIVAPFVAVVGVVIVVVVVVVVVIPGRRGRVLGVVLVLWFFRAFFQNHVEVLVVVCGPAH